MSKFKNYLLVGATIAAIGFLGGLFTENYFSSPKYVLYVDSLNTDQFKDIVVKNKSGKSYIFLGQENGTFKSLDQVKQEGLASIEKDVSSYKEKQIKILEESMKSIEDKVKNIK